MAGARKVSRLNGEAVVCVRHQVDDERGLRHTTVELLVETATLQSDGGMQVGVRIQYADEAMRARALEQGARWDPQARLWRMPLRVARALRLQRQIVQAPDLSTGRHLKSVDL
ncbi:hypothetical protein [Diaphorobacter nitroreducens]|uniref:hypothetical protein n=1 Tax=Diaphorobacter nitroreducens TaxID=164759 RepID=UPI0035AE0352